MNDDKWQRTVAKRRRQRRIQNLFACFVVLLVLLILSIIGGYYYYQRTNSPEHALEELQTAFEHRDIDTIHKYVDLKTLLPPNYKILTNDIFINDKIYTEKNIVFIKLSIPSLNPSLLMVQFRALINIFKLEIGNDSIMILCLKVVN